MKQMLHVSKHSHGTMYAKYVWTEEEFSSVLVR